ncbi:MAG TPA: DMT family protein [Myxococcaceae bacterium]|nr:DMT family protein [Myxococcaceae bacterium]
MTSAFSRAAGAIGLLIASNSFMTFAWYYHLKQRSWSLLVAIGLSWLMALPEYCFQVPANRLGHADWGGPLGAPQLKVIQEAVTLIVFSVFTTLVLGERLRGTDLAAFALVLAGVAVAMWGRLSGAA